MKKTCLLLFCGSILLVILNMALVYMASPSREQQARHCLFSVGQDAYAYRARFGSWPESIRQAWEESPVIHKPDWKNYSSDPWGNPIEYRVEDSATAFLTIRRSSRDGVTLNMDCSHLIVSRLSTNDPMFAPWVPITNAVHDSDF